MNTLKYAIIFGIFVMFVFSCQKPPNQGEVFDKVYSPQHTEKITTSKYLLGYDGKLHLVMVPTDIIISDKWYIKYKKYNEENKKWEKAYAEVSKEVYDRTNIGSWFIAIGFEYNFDK